MSKLSIIEGIGEAYETKLEAAGVKSDEALLDTCAAKKGRTASRKKREFPRN